MPPSATWNSLERCAFISAQSGEELSIPEGDLRFYPALPGGRWQTSLSHADLLCPAKLIASSATNRSTHRKTRANARTDRSICAYWTFLVWPIATKHSDFPRGVCIPRPPQACSPPKFLPGDVQLGPTRDALQRPENQE